MTSPAGDEQPEPETVLLETLDNPARGKERLPYVVGLFEAEERRTRLCAAWTCCLVATETDDDAVAYLVRRLSDRLDGEHVSLELTATLDYLSTRYPEQVERVLETVAEERRELPLPRVGNFTRNHYYDSTPGRNHVGRTRLPAGRGSDDPRRAYADREREERERVAYEREREEPDAAEASGIDREGTADERADSAERGDGSEGRSGQMVRERTAVASITTRSRFDKLHILASRRTGRYADVYDALVGQGGGERAVVLRVLRRPDGGVDPSFRDVVSAELQRWEAVDGHAHVVTVLDVGLDPRPWLVTTFTGETLADRDRLPVESAVGDAAGLASAVSHLHRNGVVHGGLDPGNVAYPGEGLDDAGRREPMLDNVGLMHAFRFHFDPERCLDPRYAAPEYFDRRYGRIDHATDVYQLGAVVYRLFTGRAPYAGGFDEVRERVLAGDPTPPSRVTGDVPDALDDVVAKAMATQKLTRYETVEHLEGDLAGLAGAGDG